MAAGQRVIDRRSVLAAIAAETADRGGAMPMWLVPVAANARSKHQRAQVDAELIALRSEGLIDYHRDGGSGNGLALTDAGRQALRDIHQGKPAKAAAKPEPKAKPKPESERRRPAVSAVDQSPATPAKLRQYAAKPLTRRASDVADTAPAPAPPPPPPEPPAPPADPERVDPECQPELAALLCDLAGEIARQLHLAHAAGDVETLKHYRALGQRLQRHIQFGGSS